MIEHSTGRKVQILYLPKEDSGLALPVLSTLYKQQQASRHALFSTSSDGCVRFFLEARKADSISRSSFSPARTVATIQAENSLCSRRHLKSKVKRGIADSDAANRKSHLLSLNVQGRIFQDDVDFSYWAEAVSSLPNRVMKFSYNAAINTLPTNANLALWYRGQVSAQCKLCGFPSQSLCHVLNKCKKALHQRRFNPRHDSVLSIIHPFLLDHICDYQILCDLPGLQYTFPPQIATTDERPGIVLWNDRKHSVILIELMIPFEDNFSDAHLRKTNRYPGLVQLCSENKYHTQLITIQVGSRGVIDLPSLVNLERLCIPKKKVWHNFLVSLSQAAISGSFAIWCSRNMIKLYHNVFVQILT